MGFQLKKLSSVPVPSNRFIAIYLSPSDSPRRSPQSLSLPYRTTTMIVCIPVLPAFTLSITSAVCHCV